MVDRVVTCNEGADILVKAALSEEFAAASGKYFDNDIGQFSSPHAEALDPEKNQQITDAIEKVLADKFSTNSSSI